MDVGALLITVKIKLSATEALLGSVAVTLISNFPVLEIGGVPLKILLLRVNQLGKGLPSAKVAE